ncbi:hypothetical protein VOLCADRAFT_106866 [Volvox carteri f. nagariensis]|uniref:Mitochondrial proton/calcium exchanger protein n=1 Tax=Volvox carteri f. nagariensis TaxID=3068 RepID=D8UA96_VOLCA|nr:uncharacterized protein VOLCADRAFT_106866 [Volvox carteri f. nagariensis]EFJ43438.1 hypothetical protein VOLCADRAFT_106866 [Volvox carteri f. nagariensis]|eukprot:XP_002955585.1 hypothetical protein VOLCADRAFT_106866 [Volvox carteri f. nagariensis]
MAMFRRSQPVWVLLGVTRHHGLPGKVDVIDLKFTQPWLLVELLSTAADTSRTRREQSVAFPQHIDHLRLLHPIVRSAIAAKSQGFHTNRSLLWPFEPSPPCLFPDSKQGKDAKSVAAPLPKAEDCDTAIQEYDDLNYRLNQLERPASLRGIGAQLKDVVVATGNGVVAIVRWTGSIPSRIQRFRSMSKEEWQAKKSQMWKNFKHEAHHYWVGFKLLAYEVRLASGYALKAASGETLTRRERRQLTRTTADLFRLVPLIIIVVVPFLEFALPVLLRLFPNMLPSTFEDKLKKEEEMKRRLAVKIELAKFLQDTVSEMAKDLQRTAKGSQAFTAVELYEFIQKIRSGAAVENHEIIRFAQLFNDALTLDNLERVQLVSMAQFVGINPFGTDQFLKNRLRAHLQQIKHDDYQIEREGLENLTEDELRQAQLQDWLDLSLHRGLPSSLLLLSRAFTITASVKDVAAKKDLAYEKLKETLSVIPEEVVETVEYEALGGAAGPQGLEKKLEFLKREEELIKEEAAAAKAVAAKAAAAAEAAPALSAAAAAGATSTLAAVAAGGASSMAFSSAGLQVATGTPTPPIFPPSSSSTASTSDSDSDSALHAGPSSASKRLGARVTKLLHSIEQELDKVESKIGDKLQLLDTDRDGLISRQELEAAISFLKTQLDPADLELLFQKLGAATADPSVPIKVDELMAVADKNRKAVEEKGAVAAATTTSTSSSSTRHSDIHKALAAREKEKRRGKTLEEAEKQTRFPPAF